MIGVTPSGEATSGNGKHDVEERESVTIRFAGDSGDGMQLGGTQFTNTSAMLGNDIATFPDFPPKFAPRPARWPASPAFRSTSAATTFTRPAIDSTRWSP